MNYIDYLFSCCLLVLLSLKQDFKQIVNFSSLSQKNKKENPFFLCYYWSFLFFNIKPSYITKIRQLVDFCEYILIDMWTL